MKKLAIILSAMIIIIGVSGCSGNGSGKTSATQAPTQEQTQEVTLPAATQKPTQAPTQAPTQPTTAAAPTQPATFEAATEIVKQASTSPTDATNPDGTVATSAGTPQEPTADANGQKTMSGTIDGMGGSTVVIDTGSGKAEFVYSNAKISNSSGFVDGAYITVTYTGSITGDNLGQAVTITVN